MLARSVTDGYFYLPPLQYIFSSRKKRMQQRNQLLVEHFASCQALHCLLQCPGASAETHDANTQQRRSLARRTSHLNTQHGTARSLWKMSERNFCLRLQTRWYRLYLQEALHQCGLFSFLFYGWLLLHISCVYSSYTILVPKDLPVGSSYSPVYLLLVFHPVYLL